MITVDNLYCDTFVKTYIKEFVLNYSFQLFDLDMLLSRSKFSTRQYDKRYTIFFPYRQFSIFVDGNVNLDPSCWHLNLSIGCFAIYAVMFQILMVIIS